MSFFRWRGSRDPDEHADETLDRAARRLSEGAVVTAAELQAYLHGIAVRLLQEHWRREQRHGTRSLDEGRPSNVAMFDPDRQQAARSERHRREQRLDCVDGCLSKLTPDAREFLLRYHSGAGAEGIAARQALARGLNIPMNALRIRACRLRQALGACVRSCVARSNEIISSTEH